MKVSVYVCVCMRANGIFSSEREISKKETHTMFLLANGNAF